MRVRKVLVVEDSKLVHKMYDIMLEQFAVIHAIDGFDALEKLKADADVDAIILDLTMPRMNGFELLDHLKESEATRRIPVIIVTTQGAQSSEERGMKAGAAAYITKPFQSTALVELIDRVSEKR
jgi:CheY-like chemotaxis protein